MAAKKKSARKKAARKTAKGGAAKKKAARKNKATAGRSKKKVAKTKAAAAKPPPAAAPADEEDVGDVDEAVAAALEALDEDEPGPPPPKPIPSMPARREKGTITLAYGAEADAAFMVYALHHEKVDTEDRRYELVRKDLTALDAEAAKGTYDVTSFSFGLYPRVDDRYLLLSCGASYGDQRGPVLVARTPIRANEVEGLHVATPGEHATANLALPIWYPEGRFVLEPVPPRHVSLLVRADRARAGILVTEDQITYRNHNLVRIVDLGFWWGELTEGLPFPVSACGIRRDIDEEERAKIALDLKRSIAYGLGHREEAVEWAQTFARKPQADAIERYVERYVNDLSLDCGERGRQAVEQLFDRALDLGIVEETVHLRYHGDED